MVAFTPTELGPTEKALKTHAVNLPCYCGETRSTLSERRGLITEKTGTQSAADIPIRTCRSCGVVRQTDLPFATEEEYANYYASQYPPVRADYGVSTHQSDLARCRRLFQRFSLRSARRFLDVGCGSGALVDVCRSEGIDAYGCEVGRYSYSPQSDHIYYRRFEDIHFPTDSFDRIVCMDVVEHTLRPDRFLAELFRVLAEDGEAIIEIPRFWPSRPEEDGGHWKRIEHIWYWTEGQFRDLLRSTGFQISGLSHPDPTKLCWRVRKPPQARKSVLLPPGVGDVYWPLTKLQSLLRREGVTPPVEAYIAAPRAKEFDSHARSFPFLKMFPFLHSADEVRFNARDPIWIEAYLRQGRTIFRDILGCDYFLTWNGYQRAGKALEEVDPDLTVEWDLPRFISLREEAVREDAIRSFGDRYLVFYWVFQGTNKYVFRRYKLPDIIRACRRIVAETGARPVFVGAEWDLQDDVLNSLIRAMPTGTVDLRGQTTLEEVFGLIRGAAGLVGANSGISIMSAAWGVPTVLLYHEYFYTGGVDRRFAWNIVPPSVRRKTYWPVFTDRSTADEFAAEAIRVIGAGTGSGDREDRVEDAITAAVSLPTLAAKRQVQSRVKQRERSKQRKPPRAKRKALDSAGERKPAKRSSSGHASIRDLEPQPELEQQSPPLPVRSIKSRFLSVQDVESAAGSHPIIACVLRSGGDYSDENVRTLQSMVARNVTTPYSFVVLTDRYLSGLDCIRLDRHLPGWWSKLELFSIRHPVLYLDLDTVILKPIDRLVEAAARVPPTDIRMLVPFSPARRLRGGWLSGIMSWRGDLSFLLYDFDRTNMNSFRGDQEYIYTRVSAESGRTIRPIQEYARVYSYKRDCLKNGGPPTDADIICFHGRLKPHNVGDRWVQDAYLGNGIG